MSHFVVRRDRFFAWFRRKTEPRKDLQSHCRHGIISPATLLKLSNWYFDVEIGFNLSARHKTTLDTSISISRAQTEHHFARIFESALNLKTTAFGQQDRAALAMGNIQ